MFRLADGRVVEGDSLKKSNILPYNLVNALHFLSISVRIAGRVVEGGSLENCRSESFQGFESLAIRQEKLVNLPAFLF